MAISIKQRFLHPPVYGRVDINDPFWKNSVVEAADMALAKLGITWRDGAVIHFKIQRLVQEMPSKSTMLKWKEAYDKPS